MTTFDKALVAALGMILLVLNAFEGQAAFGQYKPMVDLAIAVLTPIAVYLKANAPKA